MIFLLYHTDAFKSLWLQFVKGAQVTHEAYCFRHKGIDVYFFKKSKLVCFRLFSVCEHFTEHNRHSFDKGVLQ